MKKRIKDLILSYLMIFLIIGISIGNGFAIKYLGLWSILTSLLSVPVIGLLVGMGAALFEELDKEVEIDESDNENN